MTLIISGDITLRRTWQPMDPDAAAYITAVETADGQALEEPVKIAIDNFVLGCKADGIWNAIKASCILAGARTLNGALVPLAGAAPTNYNFASGDYNRKTGLVGDGSAKYLDSNRNNNADPQDSKHLCVYQTTPPDRTTTRGAIGTATFAGSSQLVTTTTLRVFRVNVLNLETGSGTINDTSASAGLWGASRSSGSAISGRYAGVTSTYSQNSQAPNTDFVDVFRRGSDYSNARIAFYSIGEALDLAKLDARVTDLINKFAEVIP